MSDLYSMNGKRVVVTGGTRGVGRAISLRLARAGAEVVANYVRDAKAAEELEAQATQEGLTIHTLRADLTSEKGAARMVEGIAERFPTISTFIHSAATGVHRPFAELTLRHFDWTYSLNVRAFFDLTHRLLGQFIQGSSILAVSSDGAVRSVPFYSVVGSSKGALESLVRHMAAEFGPRGIRVNAISPGTVLTDAWNVLPDRDERIAEAARRSPAGRLVTLEEVAAAAQFLCSDAASGVNGHTLVVDCGTRVVS